MTTAEIRSPIRPVRLVGASIPTRARGWFVAVLTLAWLVAACGEEPVPTSPRIVSFVATPSSATVGDSVTLSWQVVGADALQLFPADVDVTGATSIVVDPVTTTTYTLVATNGVGRAVADVEVPVGPSAPVILSFVATPSSALPGDPVTLSWQVVGADALKLLPGDVDVTGTSSIVVVPVTTTTYTLVATRGVGSASADLEVRVGPQPTVVSFVSEAGPPVNPGLATTLRWEVVGADRVDLLGPELGDGVDVTGSTSFEIATLPAGARYTLVAANAHGSAESEVVASRNVPAFSVLIAGQSNAAGENFGPLEAFAFIAADEGVRMFGNDYVWKGAYEPLDDCVGQVDTISMDPQSGCADFTKNTSGVSFGVSLGNRLVGVTSGSAFLIPSARSGSGVTAWLPGADRYLRSTLFGSAAHRGRLAAQQQGAPLGHEFEGAAYGAVVWYQGETDTASSSLIANFEARTRTVLNAFRAELGAPTLLVQLSRRGPTPGDPSAIERNLNYQQVREAQRLLATGARLPTSTGSVAAGTLPRTYLVVTHDLAMHPGDGRHLSAEGQRELGRRLGLAIREHLLHDASVDGSGPQLVRIEKVGTTEVRVHTDRAIRPPATTGADAYSGYFAVFAGGTPVPISSVQRFGTDDRVVRILLGQPVADTAEVRYMPPPGIITELAVDVIRSASCGADTIPGTSLCLPMAAFGAVVDAAEQRMLNLFVAPDESD